MSCKAMQFDNMTGSLSLLGLLVSLVSELQGFLGYYSTYPEMYETNDTQTQTQHYQLIEGRLYLCSELVIVMF